MFFITNIFFYEDHQLFLFYILLNIKNSELKNLQTKKKRCENNNKKKKTYYTKNRNKFSLEKSIFMEIVLKIKKVYLIQNSLSTNLKEFQPLVCFKMSDRFISNIYSICKLIFINWNSGRGRGIFVQIGMVRLTYNFLF